MAMKTEKLFLHQPTITMEPTGSNLHKRGEKIKMIYYGQELYHHGIKGQRWGVRRYQNYDGSYTQRGLKRYREANENYMQSKEAYKNTKELYKSGSATKLELNKAKNQYKTSKVKEKQAYKKLKNSYNIDEGKKLVQRGQTITGNSYKNRWTQFGLALVTSGSLNMSKTMFDAAKGHTVSSGYAATVNGLAAIGGLSIAGSIASAAATNSRNKKIRAYYNR